VSVLNKPYKQAAYEQVVAFRRRGFTYTEIAKICAVSRGTVSNWLKDLDFSKLVTVENKKKAAKDNQVRIRLVNKARIAERAIQVSSILRSAETEYKNYRRSPLFIAGLTAYQSLGDLRKLNLIRLTTKKVDSHKLFVKFCREFLGVDKKSIKFWILLYPTHNEVLCMKHWSRRIKVSVSQFHKNQVVANRSSGTKPLHFGVGNTIIGSTVLKKKLMHWIKLLEKELNV